MNLFTTIWNNFKPELDKLATEEAQVVATGIGSVMTAFAQAPTIASLKSAGGQAIGQVITVQPELGLALLQDLIGLISANPTPAATPAKT